MVSNSSDRSIDDDYARLSICVGYFIAAASEHLDDCEFWSLIRANKWDYTWDMLAQWKEYAKEHGVPVEALEPPPSRMLDTLVTIGMAIQTQYDEWRARIQK